MLKFFKHSYISQLVVIVLLIVALWIPVFLTYRFPDDAGEPTSLALTIFTFVVFGVSVFFFNSMMSVNQLVTRNSSIGAFIYVLCMSIIPIHTACFPFLLACPLIMIAMQTILLIYQVEKPEAYLMNVGFFIAIASMFYFPAIFLIIWALLSMTIMDIRQVKHYFIPIMGVIFPYFILFTFFYFNGTLLGKIEQYSLIINDLNLEKLGIGTFETIVLAIVFIMVILSLMMIKSGNADNSVVTRKKVNITLWIFFFSFLMLFTRKPAMYNGLIFVVLAMFVSMALCYIKKSKIVDIILAVFTVAVIASQYLQLFGIEL